MGVKIVYNKRICNRTLMKIKKFNCGKMVLYFIYICSVCSILEWNISINFVYFSYFNNNYGRIIWIKYTVRIEEFRKKWLSR